VDNRDIKDLREGEKFAFNQFLIPIYYFLFPKKVFKDNEVLGKYAFSYFIFPNSCSTVAGSNKILPASIY